MKTPDREDVYLASQISNIESEIKLLKGELYRLRSILERRHELKKEVSREVIKIIDISLFKRFCGGESMFGIGKSLGLGSQTVKRHLLNGKKLICRASKIRFDGFL